MFQVRWAKNALDGLADIWVRADSNLRKAITRANHRIDNALRADPWSVGESRSAGVRVGLEAPIGYFFRIEPGGSEVSVLKCGYSVKGRRACRALRHIR